MTNLIQSDHGNWSAHAHIDRYRAEEERAVMHTLYPTRSALLEKAVKGGWDSRLPQILRPHVTGADYQKFGIDPFGTMDEPGNLLVNVGINRLGALLINSGATQAYDATHTAIGAGDTATAAAASQTDLSATINAANRWVQIVDSAPTFATQVLTCVATFATANGNFAWAEWAIGQNTTSAAAAITSPMLNRKVAALGTKTSAAAWAFTVTITIS